MPNRPYRFIAFVVLAALFASSSFSSPQSSVQAATSACASSGPASGAYTVTVCFTSPAAGAVLTGDSTVTATVSVTGTNPGVRRIVFYLDGAYLLTDYESLFTFTLPSARWVDGSHSLAVEASMRDGFTSQQASLSVTFANGVSSPPVNTNTWQPTGGTTPVAGAPFVVVATGDGASGETTAAKVSDLVASLNPNLFLYLGDVYEKGTTTEFSNWYGLSTYFGRLRSITDPTIGNHEYTGGAAPGYFDYWNNIPNWYSFDAGGWHFVSLNSNSSNVKVNAGSPEYNWLQQDLAAVPPQECTIVYYHHPLFNIGPEGPTSAMSDIWSLMAQSGVDIVLNGHDHDYQRWVPLDGNGNPAPNGITEFVAGAGGHSMQHPTLSDSRVAYSNSTSPTAFGALVLQLNATGASFTYRSSSGTILDSGVVPCVGAGGDSAAPSTPGNLQGMASSSTQVDLSWTASTDNVGVEGYTVYRNGIAITTVPPTQLSYSDTGVLPSNSYNYAVDAYDLAGNHSPVTPSITVLTPNASGAYVYGDVADAYVNASFPTTNYGTATTLRADASPDVHSYLRFSVAGLGGRPITSALLKVYSNSSSSMGISVVPVSSNAWDEKTVTYSTAPALGTVASSSGAISSGSWVTLDLSAYITAEGTYSFGLTTPGTTALSFQSKEASANQPQLVLTVGSLSAPTPTPTLLATATPTSTPLPATATPTATALSLPTATDTPLPTATDTPLPAPAPTDTPFPLATPTDTPLPVSTPTDTPLPPTATPTLGATSITFVPQADAYVNASYPSTNYGSSTVLRADASPDLHSYVRFSVTGLNGLPVTRARLLFYMNSSTSAGMKALAVSDNTWGEKAITYSNAPVLGATLATSGALTAGAWVSLDVTSYITGEGTYSFGLITPGSTAISFASRETGANAPQLIIDLGP